MRRGADLRCAKCLSCISQGHVLQVDGKAYHEVCAERRHRMTLVVDVDEAHLEALATWVREHGATIVTARR